MAAPAFKTFAGPSVNNAGYHNFNWRLISDLIGEAPGENLVTGAGTVNFLPIFTAAGVLGDSLLSQSGSTITVGANLTVTGDDFIHSKSMPGNVVADLIENTSNTATSSARQRIKVAGSSAGDPFTLYSITGLADWSVGVDNSDSDAFVISEGTTPGASNRLRIAVGGAISVPGAMTVTGAGSFSGGKVRTGATGVTGSNTDVGYLIVGTTAAAQIQFGADEIQAMLNNSVTDLFFNFRGGNVVVGNATPAGKLTVAGSAHFTGAISIGNITSSSVDNTVTHKVKINVDGTDRYFLTTTSAA